MALDRSPEFYRWPEPIFFFFSFREFTRISYYPYSASNSPFTNAMFIDGSKFHEQFLKGSWPPKEHFYEIISESDESFQKRRFFKNIFMSVWCKMHPIIRAMFTDRSKFRDQFLKRVTQGTFLWNYFSLTSGFREEDFLRICPCPHSAKSPQSPEPCLLTDQNFTTNFWKGSPKNHSCEIISKSDKEFQRRFFKNFFMSIQYKKLPFTRAMFMDRSKSFEQFWKGSPKEYSCEIITKSDQRRRFLKNCLKNLISLPWQPEFLMESNSVNNF